MAEPDRATGGDADRMMRTFAPLAGRGHVRSTATTTMVVPIEEEEYA